MFEMLTGYNVCQCRLDGPWTPLSDTLRSACYGIKVPFANLIVYSRHVCAVAWSSQGSVEFSGMERDTKIGKPRLTSD